MHGTKVLHTIGALSRIDSLNCFLFAVATVRFEQNSYVVNESVVSFTIIGVILTGDISIPIDARYV